MDVAAVLLGLLLGTLVAAAFTTASGSDLYDIDVGKLARGWAAARLSPTHPSTLKYTELKGLIQSLVCRYPQVLRSEMAGSSVEGREIFLVTAGNGPGRILLWSQMHGDEPTATGALIDLMSYIGRHRDEPWVARILGRYKLLFIPMLNPDGAELPATERSHPEWKAVGPRKSGPRRKVPWEVTGARSVRLKSVSEAGSIDICCMRLRRRL